MTLEFVEYGDPGQYSVKKIRLHIAPKFNSTTAPYSAANHRPGSRPTVPENLFADPPPNDKISVPPEASRVHLFYYYTAFTSKSENPWEI